MTIIELLKKEFQRKNHFDFPSESFEGEVWIVSKDEYGNLRCSCPGAFEHRTCKHIKFFYRWIKGYEKLDNYWGKINEK